MDTTLTVAREVIKEAAVEASDMLEDVAEPIALDYSLTKDGWRVQIIIERI